MPGAMGGMTPPGGMMPPGGRMPPGGMTPPRGRMPPAIGAGREELEMQEAGGELFQGIGFTLKLRMNLQLLPKLMANILEKGQMDPDLGMFTDIKTVTFQKLERVPNRKIKFPEVYVEITGVVLDFIEKKEESEKKSKEAEKKPRPRR